MIESAGFRPSAISWVRGVVTLAIGMLVAGIFSLGPASSAAKPLTKAKANKLYVNVGEKASDADKLDGLDSSQLSPASAVASTNPTDIDLTITPQEVISTSITLGGTRRIMGVASLDLYANTSGDLIFCRMRIDGIDAGQNASANTPDVNGYDIQMPVIGSAIAGQGAHTVSVVCNEDGPDNVFDRGDLLVWAV